MARLEGGEEAPSAVEVAAAFFFGDNKSGETAAKNGEPSTRRVRVGGRPSQRSPPPRMAGGREFESPFFVEKGERRLPLSEFGLRRPRRGRIDSGVGFGAASSTLASGRDAAETAPASTSARP